MASAPAPRAPQKPVTRSHHGHDFVDDYEWLRAKDDPEVVAHLEAENAHTEAETAHLADLRQTVFDEIKGRVQETDLGVPVREGSWWYYSRTAEGRQYGIHCRAPISGPDDWTPPAIAADRPADGEQVLLDGNVEADGHEFFSLGSFDVSADGTRLAWAVDTTGDERYVLRVRDLEVVPGAALAGTADAVGGQDAGRRALVPRRRGRSVGLVATA